MKYIPKRNPAKAIIYMIVLAVCGIALVGVSMLNVPLKWLIQFASLMCLVLFIKTLTRHLLYTYEYSFDSKSFSVVQKSGNRQTDLCNLDLSTAACVLTKTEFLSQKKNIGHIKTSYNYTQNFMPDNKCYYIFEFNGNRMCVAFEADEAFLNALRAEIKHVQ